MGRLLSIAAVVLALLSLPSLLSWTAATFVLLTFSADSSLATLPAGGLVLIVVLGWWGWFSLFWSVPQISVLGKSSFPGWVRVGYFLVVAVVCAYWSGFAFLDHSPTADLWGFIAFLGLFAGGAPALLVLVLCAKSLHTKHLLALGDAT